MNDEIKEKLISKLKIWNGFISSLNRKNRYGFLFGDNKHSLIFEKCSNENFPIMVKHYWGNSDDIYYHKVYVECILYDSNHNALTFANTHGFHRRKIVSWLYSYSFQNEELKINWDEFFKNMDLFIIQYI